jgi:hypothetical protein
MVLVAETANLLPMRHIFGAIGYYRRGTGRKVSTGGVTTKWAQLLHHAVTYRDFVPKHLRSIAAWDRGAPEPTRERTASRRRAVTAPIRRDPVSRIGSHRSEIIVRLGLIEVARIEAGTVGRSQFSVVDVADVKAFASATPRG